MLKDSSRSAGRQRSRGARVLVATQVAVSLVLLVGCGLFLRTLYNLKAETLGYDRTGLIMAATDPAALQKLDKPLRGKAAQALGRSRVIVRGLNGVSDDELATIIRGLGGSNRRSLRLIGARVADLPDGALAALASHPRVAQVSEDRPIVGAMERTGATVGATAVRRDLGYDGTGVGVAVIDSGAAPAHDDLTANGASVIDRFVDFVGGQNLPYDDYGHGTHVAGIIAGSGYDSGGKRTGIAPGARLTVLKALDSKGNGYISDVIAALDYVVANKDELNIRVVNLSIATGVYESYTTDPLTVAAENVVRNGIVVVAAAGNNGRGPNGTIRRGGVTAPGNAPSVLTVGASSHMGTIDRAPAWCRAICLVYPFSISVLRSDTYRGPGSSGRCHS